MAYCCIALGGNKENPEASFHAALELLQNAGHKTISLSSVYRTPAMGADAGKDFLNAAAVLETDQSPDQLLAELHRVEAELGRSRTQHWGPRIIDLDLLLYGDTCLDNDQIVVPHPCMWYRRFVMAPLAEIASEWVHPLLNATNAELLARLSQLPLRIQLPPDVAVVPTELTRIFSKEFDPSCFEFVAAKQDGSNLFAKVVAPLVTKTNTKRTQPQSETECVIKCPISSDLNEETQKEIFTEFLRNILTAALPFDAKLPAG